MLRKLRPCTKKISFRKVLGKEKRTVKVEKLKDVKISSMVTFSVGIAVTISYQCSSDAKDCIHIAQPRLSVRRMGLEELSVRSEKGAWHAVGQAVEAILAQANHNTDGVLTLLG